MGGERRGRMHKMLSRDGEVVQNLTQRNGGDLPPGVSAEQAVTIDMSKVPDSIAHRMLMAQKLTEMCQHLIVMTLQPHKFTDRNGVTPEMGSREHIMACDVEFTRIAGAAVLAMGKADEEKVIERQKLAGAPEAIIGTTRLMFKAGRDALALIEAAQNDAKEPPAQPG